MYQKKKKTFLQTMSPHLSQLNVAMAYENYFRRNNLQILKFETYAILGANWQLFRFYFIFYFVYTKHQVLLICNEN